jgi:hypothetical protein
VEHLAIEEQEGAEGLVLGGGGDVCLDGQVGQECFHLGGAHFDRVAHVVEKDVAFDPANVGLLGADGVVLETDGVADLSSSFFGRFSSTSCLLRFDKNGF